MLHISTAQGYGAPQQITPRAVVQGQGDSYLLSLSERIAQSEEPVEHELHGSGECLLRALPRGVLPLGLFAVEGNPRVHLLREVAVVAHGHVDLCA